MILSNADLRRRLADAMGSAPTLDPFMVVPLLHQGSTGGIDDGGAIQGCSIDLRLGTWFEITRSHAHASRIITGPLEDDRDDERPSKTMYVPYGREFYLHPGSFVLGVTIEWIRIPKDLAGTVSGKSQWTRRGLNVSTSTVVHPYFVGCLTLELANTGEFPIALSPGISICQITIEALSSEAELPVKASPLVGQRRAVHTEIRRDERARALKAEP